MTPVEQCRQGFFLFSGGTVPVQTILLVALCGAVGCAARYCVSGWVYDLTGTGFPYGTLAVNIAGAFLVGVVMGMGARSTILPPNVRFALVIGLLGGLTTFSTFSYETLKQIEGGHFLLAATNILASVLLCLFFTWLGIITTRHL
jgi:CrcB protein